jgi:hypothetical protein
LNQDERLYLTCFRFSTNGVAYNAEVFDDEDLIQVQMTCAAVPSPTFNIMQLVKVYKEKAATPADGTSIPEDITEVADQYGAQFTYVGKKTHDPDAVGFKKNRSGWYVSYTSLKSFLMYFDDLMSFRSRHSDSEFDEIGSTLQIVLRMGAGIADALKLDQKEDELLCRWSVEKEEDETTWPVRVFDLPPPNPTYPLRFIIMTMELTAADKMNVIFGGNTKPFQAEFNTEDIKLKVQKISDSAYPEYYRVIEHVKIDEDVTECVEKLTHVLEKILHGSPVMVQLNVKTHDTELVQKVITEIKKLPNIEVRD